MNLKKVFASLTAAALTCCMASAFTGVQAEESEKLRIMPLGDSITDGFNIVGGYRTPLWYMLEESGYTDGIDFVGPNWGGGGDPNHAGYSGYAIADIEGQRSGIYNFIDWLMTDYPADVVMLQIGTNDILSSCTDGMADRLELLVDAVLSYLPDDGLLYLATIPYMDADVTDYTNAYTVEEMDAAVDTYNADVKALIAEKQAEGKPIVLSDINSVLTKADLADGVHPSQDGYNKMAAYWYDKLTDYIDGDVQKPTSPTESTTETTTEEPTTEPTEASTDEPVTEPTEPTEWNAPEPVEGASGYLNLALYPDKTIYEAGFTLEDLDFTGLEVAIDYSYTINEGDELCFVDTQAYPYSSPFDYPEVYIVDASAVRTEPGIYPITIRVTEEIQERYNVHNEVTFNITVLDAIGMLDGDINHDGVVSVLDVIALQKYLLGVGTLDTPYPHVADMNGDNIIDIFDLALLKRAVLNQ